MYQSALEGGYLVLSLVVFAVLYPIYKISNKETRNFLVTSWWWLCPAVFGLLSLLAFGDLWGAIKTALVSIFYIGIPGAIILSLLDKEK